jgi:hypothetical protein
VSKTPYFQQGQKSLLPTFPLGFVPVQKHRITYLTQSRKETLVHPTLPIGREVGLTNPPKWGIMDTTRF